MDKDEILRHAVLQVKKEPIGFNHKAVDKRERELAEASGRLIDERLERIEKKLQDMQSQLKDSDRKAPMQSIWTGAIAGVLSAIASYFVMKYVTTPTTTPLTTPTTTANSKIEKASIDHSDH